MKKLALLFIAVLALQTAGAQEVTFSVSSGVSDPGFQRKIESAVSALLTEFGRAFDAKDTPDFSGIPITDGAAASARMLLTWAQLARDSPSHTAAVWRIKAR